MRFKKSVLAGVLALGTMVGAGAASAAPYTYSVSGGNTVPFTVVYGSDAVKLANQYGIDLNALLQSIEKSAGSNFGWTGHYIQWPTGTNAGTGGGKVTKPSPAKPSQPTASQPPKSQPTANKPASRKRFRCSVPAFCGQRQRRLPLRHLPAR
ncbi:hypothetical protein LJK87_46970 [Paenibacillus sp. P25]|nr:hypothetical protein LJK87_46970 [Paenibacillus sp. P25]